MTDLHRPDLIGFVQKNPCRVTSERKAPRVLQAKMVPG